MRNSKGFIQANTPRSNLRNSKVEITPFNLPHKSRGKTTPSNSGANGQSKTESAMESAFNILGGFLVGMVAQKFIFPLFDIHISSQANFEIAVCFSFVSFARSYAFRRLFNMNQVRSYNGK